MADRLLDVEDLIESRYEQAMDFVRASLDKLKTEGPGTRSPRFKTLLATLQELRARKLARIQGGEQELEPFLRAIGTASEEKSQLQGSFEKCFNQCVEQQSRVLRVLASDPKFQEAVIWQNRQAHETAIRPLLASNLLASNGKQRRREQLVAKYLQRYSVKNDTIGFFGPVAWGMIEPGESLLKADPGPSIIRSRRVYFEQWATDTIALHLSSIPGIQWWIPPVLFPHCYLKDGMLHAPPSSPKPMDPLQQSVLTHCNAENLPADILASVRQNPSFSHLDKADLCEVLNDMVAAGILRWQLLTPLQIDSNVALRRRLLEIKDQELRQQALDVFAPFETALHKVSMAAGNTEKLTEALNELELIFEQVTSTKSYRKPGLTYAARTIVCEDCQRDLTVVLSPEILSSVLPAFSLLLQSLRWLGRATGNAFREVFNEVYEEVGANMQLDQVPAADFWAAMTRKLFDSPPPAVAEVEHLFHDKWRSILPEAAGTRSVQFKSCMLQARVGQEFPAIPAKDHPFCYYCPDLMISAPSTDAIRRGECDFVLGEMHFGLNTLASTVFVEQHPFPQELVEGAQNDFAADSFKIIPSRFWKRVTVRTNEGLFHPATYLAAATTDAVPPEGHTAHPLSDLMICKREGRLLVVSCDQSRSFDILTAFSDLLGTYLGHKASFWPAASYCPRVAIDKLVIQRETWRMGPDALSFAFAEGQSQRFLGARKWMRSRGIPQIMFVKSPLEEKPFYVDLDSPVFVDILCKTVRELRLAKGPSREIAFSEMLPGTRDAWLPGASGETFTSELRFAIIERQPSSMRSS